MNRLTLAAAAALAVVCACTDDSAPTYTSDCLGLDETTAYDCLEARFWRTFQVDFDQRMSVYDLYQPVLDEHADYDDYDYRSRIVLRRGQLALAISLENDPPNPAYWINLISPDFDLAGEINPDNPIAVSWKASIDMAIAHITGDNDRAVQIFNDAVDRIEAAPLGNVPSISGTSIGMPLSTGVPERTIELVDAWECRGVAWCSQNTEHGPWVMPGMAYHWAEHYARVGNRAKTVAFLDQATSAPGYADWPYNWVVDDAVADVDGLLDKFAAVGQDGSAFGLMYSNQKWGCKFCHAK